MLGKIKQIVAKVFEIPIDQLSDRCKANDYSYPRFAYYYLAYNFSNFTLRDIGGAVKRTDHTTVMHGIQQAKNMIEMNGKFKDKIQECMNILGFKPLVNKEILESIDNEVLRSNQIHGNFKSLFDGGFITREEYLEVRNELDSGYDNLEKSLMDVKLQNQIESDKRERIILEATQLAAMCVKLINYVKGKQYE